MIRLVSLVIFLCVFSVSLSSLWRPWVSLSIGWKRKSLTNSLSSDVAVLWPLFRIQHQPGRQVGAGGGSEWPNRRRCPLWPSAFPEKSAAPAENRHGEQKDSSQQLWRCWTWSCWPKVEHLWSASQRIQSAILKNDTTRFSFWFPQDDLVFFVSCYS